MMRFIDSEEEFEISISISDFAGWKNRGGYHAAELTDRPTDQPPIHSPRSDTHTHPSTIRPYQPTNHRAAPHTMPFRQSTLSKPNRLPNDVLNNHNITIPRQ
jgi:hypothetical protein